MTDNQKNKNKAVLYFDGACRGNGHATSRSAVGYALYEVDETTMLAKDGMCVPAKTNNESEYTALITGLRKALQMGIKDIVCKGDSMLVVMQMEGKWKTLHPVIREFQKKGKELAGQFRSIRFVHVRREQNAVADGLANRALDCGAGAGTPCGDNKKSLKVK